MPVLLVVAFVVLVVIGFFKPIVWLAAGLLIYGVSRYYRASGRRFGRRDDAEYFEYRRNRALRDRFDRRYRHDEQHGLWSRWRR